MPGYLKARVEARLGLPQVEVLAGQQNGEGWEATEVHAAEMQADLLATLVLVVEGLSEELFTELLQGFHPPR
jgi:hypothetical protein